MSLNGRKLWEQILAVLRRKDYRPMDKTEIGRELRFKGRERVILRQNVRELEHRRASATKSWSAWTRGNRATSILKAKSSKYSDRHPRRASTCFRSSANTTSAQNFRRMFWIKRSGFPSESMCDNSKDAKIC